MATRLLTKATIPRISSKFDILTAVSVTIYRVTRSHTDKRRCLSSGEVEAFNEDGVVCLREVFSKDWIEKVTRGIAKNVSNPSKFSERLYNDNSESSYFNDYLNWRNIPEFSEFVWESPAPHIARQLMISQKVAFYHEHVFTKDPGTCSVTPWHHDQAYYPIDGLKNCSLWLPVTAVARSACLRYVKGSHKWGKWFVPKKFATNRNYENTEVSDDFASDMVDVESGDYELLAWDVEPGDCVAFHMRTIHGASESTDDMGRQVLATRWLGDDAILASRPWQTSPPLMLNSPLATHGHSVFNFPECFPVILKQ